MRFQWHRDLFFLDPGFSSISPQIITIIVKMQKIKKWLTCIRLEFSWNFDLFIFTKKPEVNKYSNSYVPAENTQGYVMIIILLKETLNFILYLSNLPSINKLVLKIIPANKGDKSQIKLYWKPTCFCVAEKKLQEYENNIFIQ